MIYVIIIESVVIVLLVLFILGIRFSIIKYIARTSDTVNKQKQNITTLNETITKITEENTLLMAALLRVQVENGMKLYNILNKRRGETK
jgi:cell division protein FtsB